MAAVGVGLLPLDPPPPVPDSRSWLSDGVGAAVLVFRKGLVLVPLNTDPVDGAGREEVVEEAGPNGFVFPVLGRGVLGRW